MNYHITYFFDDLTSNNQHKRPAVTTTAEAGRRPSCLKCSLASRLLSSVIFVLVISAD